MKNLINSIKSAKTSDELKNIVNSIPKQENGHKTQLAGHLIDAFWYTDMQDDINKQKLFMIKVVCFYQK